jgi:hypothetical protein
MIIRKEKVLHSAPRSCFLTLTYTGRNQGSLEKWLILGLGQEIHEMSVEYTVEPEINHVLCQRGWK